MLFIREIDPVSNDFEWILSVEDKLLIASSKNHPLQTVQVPNTPLIADEKQKLPSDKDIICFDISKDNKYIGLTTEGKQLTIFDSTHKVVKNILLPRIASKICFTPLNDHILVADRTGDVYDCNITSPDNDLTLLLGHLSVISDMLISDCGKYVITSDRDDKIRVSHYPNAYNIKTYCLGHTEFITTLKISSEAKMLFSASGDGTVRVWNYLEGKQLQLINPNELLDKTVVETFVNEMDLDKVDVQAVPVTDIQVRDKQSFALLAVSLHNIKKVFVYQIDVCTLDYSLFHTVEVETQLSSIYLGDRLYILTDKLQIFNFNDKSVTTDAIVAGLLLGYSKLIKRNININFWFKRKVDNVQDYMERKRLRLESK